MVAHSLKSAEQGPKQPSGNDAHSTPSDSDFSEEFYESVVGGLRNAIGEAPTEAATYLMGFSMSTASPEEFSGRLRRVFGAGSVVLEKLVAKELYQRLRLPYSDSTDFDFGACVKRARDAVSARSKGGHG